MIQNIEQCLKAISFVVAWHYGYNNEEYSVHEGDADYYIDVKIKDPYIDAVLVEELEDIGFTINSFQSLDGKYDDKFLSFSLKGELIID